MVMLSEHHHTRPSDFQDDLETVAASSLSQDAMGSIRKWYKTGQAQACQRERSRHATASRWVLHLHGGLIFILMPFPCTLDNPPWTGLRRLLWYSGTLYCSRKAVKLHTSKQQTAVRWRAPFNCVFGSGAMHGHSSMGTWLLSIEAALLMSIFGGLTKALGSKMHAGSVCKSRLYSLGSL